MLTVFARSFMTATRNAPRGSWRELQQGGPARQHPQQPAHEVWDPVSRKWRNRAR